MAYDCKSYGKPSLVRIQQPSTMFDMLVKFLKTYTIWGQYISDKHYNNMYYITIFAFIIFVFLNLVLYL